MHVRFSFFFELLFAYEGPPSLSKVLFSTAFQSPANVRSAREEFAITEKRESKETSPSFVRKFVFPLTKIYFNYFVEIFETMLGITHSLIDF